MPIEVSMSLVMGIDGKADYLPKELVLLFNQVRDAAHKKTGTDYTLISAIADWFEEHGEPELAATCRYIVKRKLTFRYNADGYTYTKYTIEGIPESVRNAPPNPNGWGWNIYGPVALLAAKLKSHREEGL